MEMEIICISSDDESDSQKENKTDKPVTNSIEIVNGPFVHGKMETLFSDNEKVEEKNLKRKTDKEEITYNNIEIKKKKLNIDQGPSTVINKPLPGLRSIYVSDIHPVKPDNAQSNKDQEVMEKMQLVVKEKKKISYISQNVFPLFISLCLQKCSKNDKADMDKIVNKLKRRYEELDPVYARSENFNAFLNEKREAIMNNNKKIYLHIEEVMNELKKKNKKNSQALQNNEIYDAVPSTSYATNSVPANNTVESDNNDDDNEDDNEENASSKTRRKIKQVLYAMKKCEATIKRLEEEEVDFNEENDSNYIKVERYKRRMVELYNKLCELTGENTDAGRVYLRPKHLNITQIVVVDQAITNFINSKITRRNKMKKMGTLANDLIFPDYRDILQCVNRCNDKKNLGLDTKKQKKIAEKAFKELGEHLQRTRFNDYWDTFSLYLENTEDPAVKDKNLAKKLADNRTEGEKRLAAVFEKYTKKQEEIKDQNNEEITSEDEEDEEEESIMDDEDKNEDNLSITSEKISDNEKDIDKTVKETRLPMETNKPAINMINVYRAKDKAISNKTADTLQEKCNEKIKIRTFELKMNAAVSKNNNKTISGKVVYKSCSSNTSLKNIVKKVVDTKTPEDSLPTVSTANCPKDLAEVETEGVPTVITYPAAKKVKDVAAAITRVTAELITEDTAELITGDTTELITGDTAELVSEDTAELITGDIAELITGDITEMEDATEVITDETEIITENVMDGAIENMSNDEQLKEIKKPILRLRSFAKPPTTWEDNQHKTDKIAQENAPKVANQTKEIVDLTNEGTAKSPPVVTKCTIQLGNKIVPIVKRQALLIPANRNIISVQNITNNYLRVNTRTGQIIAPVRDLPIRGSTLIRLPCVPTTSRQNQPQNANTVTIRNKIPLRGKEILRIIPKNSIIVSEKSAVPSVSKQTDVSSSTTKSSK